MFNGRTGFGAMRARTEGESTTQRGAVLVEFALVAMLLISLVFGTIDFGLTLHELQTLQHGSRAGARNGVVSTFGSDWTCPIAPLSGPAGLETQSLICLTKSNVGLDDADVRVKILFGVQGYVEGEPMVICVQYPMKSTTGLFSPFLNGRVIEARTEMRIEEIGSATIDAVEEQSLPGGDWTSCTVG